MLSNADRGTFAVVRGNDQAWFEVKFVRGLDRPVPWLAPGGGGAGLILLGVIAVRWLRWLAAGRRWSVRVTRSPTLRGDDQRPQIVAEVRGLSRQAALDHLPAVRAEIGTGALQDALADWRALG